MSDRKGDRNGVKREDRRAAALRENLKRRKQAARKANDELGDSTKQPPDKDRN